MKKKVNKKRSVIRKKFDRLFQYFDPVIFGYLSNWGVLFVSLILVKGFEINTFFSLLLYPLLSLGALFLIGNAKYFKIGFSVGFLTGFVILLKTYIFPL